MKKRKNKRKKKKKEEKKLTQRVDPLPDWPHHHHRPQKDPSLLRAQTKSQGHSGILRGPDIDLDALDARRLLGRSVRDSRSIWRLLGHDCRLCEGNTRCWTVHWHGG
ncbi:uncharacterized protein MAM_03969 [Metarhizium album ARSEF 1941]|uniref:Uncharacterized protein n=1 Tax=Metarhizium album (strain ARSEF 1941) TaxID=1081103 RepID=A0A0B2WVX3_METAS|nr:uncharacterized protein MAM_03969 [Metarhizium album ARSEF 1941]KHN98208.1 hypothetical protein MAM_03969 [Metarhizium album ARSEF 1941]